MKDLHVGFAKANWPRPADQAAAERERAAWAEASAQIDKKSAAFAKRLAADKTGRRLLDALFGNTPFLSHAAVEDPEFTVRLLRAGPDETLARITADLEACIGGSTDTATVMTELRRAKRRIALLVGLADIAEVWTLEQVTGALSDFAEQAASLAVRHLLREAQASGALPRTDAARPELGSGLVVIGMGKLGARELNYSSDIDLIVLYDHERIPDADPSTLQHAFVRLTRGLVRLLEERSQDGYVFRTDLRLRPDPGSTPIAMSVAAAEAY